MKQKEIAQSSVCDSEFYMLRALVAMAHADGVLHEKERAYIIDFAVNLPLADAQLKALMNDLYVPQNPADLLPEITDIKYIAQLTHFARLMAYKDGVFAPSEEDLLEKMYSYQKIKLSEEVLNLLKHTTKENVKVDLNNLEVTDKRAYQSKKRITWFELNNILFKNSKNDKE